MKTYGTQAAINTHFFNMRSPYNIRGFSVSCGKLVAPLENSKPPRSTLLITKDNTAHFELTDKSFDINGYWTAVESLHYILDNGYIPEDNRDLISTDTHPRSSVGLSKDGRYLFLMTIDGRQKGYSAGATLKETAQWLKRFGAYNGLALDGGGSTHLLIEDANGQPKTLNSPSENRAVASHLGIYADKLCQ